MKNHGPATPAASLVDILIRQLPGDDVHEDNQAGPAFGEMSVMSCQTSALRPRQTISPCRTGIADDQGCQARRDQLTNRSAT
jgi:hypothetical protein